MYHIVLFEPEIPPNTGNIIRLCANTGLQLHLIEPFGFELSDKKMRRAGLDYHEWAHVKTYANYDEFLATAAPKRLFGLSTKATNYYHEVTFEDGDFFMFGPETRGLPDNVMQGIGENLLRVPMKADSRSLNLSNTVAIIAYEAIRQSGFKELL